MMVAAVMPGSKPRPAPMPMSATPTVPMVPHDVPVKMEVSEQTMRLVTRKMLGEMILSPA